MPNPCNLDSLVRFVHRVDDSVRFKNYLPDHRICQFWYHSAGFRKADQPFYNLKNLVRETYGC